IVTIDPYNSSLLITKLKVTHPDSVIVEDTHLDSLSISLKTGEWAYSLQRDNISILASSLKLLSTYKRIIRFDHEFKFENIKQRDVARVEIIFYVNKSK